MKTREKGDDVTVQELIKTHPRPTGVDRETLVRCIDRKSVV